MWSMSSHRVWESLGVPSGGPSTLNNKRDNQQFRFLHQGSLEDCRNIYRQTRGYAQWLFRHARRAQAQPCQYSLIRSPYKLGKANNRRLLRGKDVGYLSSPFSSAAPPYYNSPTRNTKPLPNATASAHAPDATVSIDAMTQMKS